MPKICNAHDADVMRMQKEKQTNSNLGEPRDITGLHPLPPTPSSEVQVLRLAGDSEMGLDCQSSLAVQIVGFAHSASTPYSSEDLSPSRYTEYQTLVIVKLVPYYSTSLHLISTSLRKP